MTMTSKRSLQSPRERSSDLGLTLVELMITRLLFSILSAGAFVVVSGQQKSNAVHQQVGTALDNARSTLSALARQVRAAKAGMPDGVTVNRALSIPAGATRCLCRTGLHSVRSPEPQRPGGLWLARWATCWSPCRAPPLCTGR